MNKYQTPITEELLESIPKEVQDQLFDILNNVVYSANKSNVVLTMVDGEVLYKNGEFTTIDVEKMGYEVSRLVREVVNEVKSNG